MATSVNFVNYSRARRWVFAGALLFVAVALLVLAQPGAARAGEWSRQESGTSASLSSVFFLNEKTGWAVGEAGTIIATADGGAHWTAQTSGTSEHLRSVWFVDGQRGWTAGHSGTVLSTVDGGVSWQSAAFYRANGQRLADFGPRYDVNSIGFLPDGHGWIAGCGAPGTQYELRVLRTEDWGRTWTEATVGTGYSYVNRVVFSDGLNGVAVGGNSLILQTSDGGNSWTPRWPTSWPYWYAHFRDVSFLSADQGLMFYGSWILRTADKGMTWTPSPDGRPDTAIIAVSFGDSQRGWAVGYDNDDTGNGVVILGSEDGGATWNLELRNTGQAFLTSVFALDATHVWAVGGYGQIWTNSSAPNTDPEVALPSGASVQEGRLFEATGSFTDPDADEWTGTVDYGDGSGSQELILAADKSFLLSHTYKDDGEYTVSVAVHDNAGGFGIASTQVSVANVAPEITGFSGPIDPVRVGASTTLQFAFGDPGVLDTHTWSVNWGDGQVTQYDAAGLGGSAVHVYSAPGVYTPTLTVADDDGGTDGRELTHFVVVYDPAGGFVTGGGWINSPAGAFFADPSLTGKATFGFEAKYKKGATLPTGNTEFQFKTAGINFKSTEYEWLVIAGAKAQFKGIGSINGVGRYGFMLTAVDGALLGRGKADTFRVKIWDETGAIVYDNLLGASDTTEVSSAIGGGSIVVHK